LPSKSKSKNKKAAKAKSKKSKPAAIPTGFRSITPYLSIEGAADAIEWYKKAFNAKELARNPMPDGKIMHARIRIGDSIVMMSDAMGMEGPTKSPKALGGTTTTMHIYSKNVDKMFQQAVDAGAKVLMALDNQFWGERYGSLQDPFGHTWSISMVVPMSKQEMKEKQEKAMAMFSQGQHPGREEPAQQSMSS
jgi:PhnB protein